MSVLLAAGCFAAGFAVGVVLLSMVAAGAYDKGYIDAMLGREPR